MKQSTNTDCHLDDNWAEKITFKSKTGESKVSISICPPGKKYTCKDRIDAFKIPMERIWDKCQSISSNYKHLNNLYLFIRPKDKKNMSTMKICLCIKNNLHGDIGQFWGDYFLKKGFNPQWNNWEALGLTGWHTDSKYHPSNQRFAKDIMDTIEECLFNGERITQTNL